MNEDDTKCCCPNCSGGYDCQYWDNGKCRLK